MTPDITSGPPLPDCPTCGEPASQPCRIEERLRIRHDIPRIRVHPHASRLAGLPACPDCRAPAETGCRNRFATTLQIGYTCAGRPAAQSAEAN